MSSGGLWRVKRFWLRIAIRLFVIAMLMPIGWIGLKFIMNTQTRIWLPNYTKDLLSFRYSHGDQTKHMFVHLCDHWEPGHGAETLEAGRDWISRFKPIAQSHRDSQGRTFRYPWFYPIDRFDPAILSELSLAAFEGYGEIEVHWHPSHSSSAAFEKKFREALTWFTTRGALVPDPGAESSSVSFMETGLSTTVGNRDSVASTTRSPFSSAWVVTRI